MISHPPNCKLLILFIVLLVSLTTGELEFYQDVESASPEDVNLKSLERFLQTQRHHDIHHTRSLPHLHPPIYDDDLDEYRREQEKKILEALLENPEILETLENDKMRNANYQHRPEYNIMNEYQRSIEREERPYINLESPSNTYDYPKIKLPYPVDPDEKVYYSSAGRIPMRMSLPNWQRFATSDVDNSLARLRDNQVPAEISKLHHSVNRLPILTDKEPEFTYNFDQPNMKVKSTFAVKPNDPRYYERDVGTNTQDKQMIIRNDNDLSRTAENENLKKTMSVEKLKLDHHPVENDMMSSSEISNYKNIMPEPQRRADRNPIVTSSTYKVNNDAYFIAIVAGCSAAAMFALVLISLTWCRLQRGAKAAADIEYPAYGVTGPNKDVSPSGDQRLAHSAQMYHFQHQKQQIIAMEKTTASREPGSISEAESDEENEEGDYTVYECPGLAPAGEMEVKNPLFHDDATPATPPPNHKDKDHQHH